MRTCTCLAVVLIAFIFFCLSSANAAPPTEKPLDTIPPATIAGMEFRIWTGANGRKLELAFVKFEDGTVHFKRKDGTDVSTPIKNLSEVDQEWVRERVESVAKKKDGNNVETPNSATSAEAWRSSLSAFTKEVVAVAEKSKMANAEVGITRIRGGTTFMNAKGDDIWVLFQEAFDHEFHGELAKHFTGQVSWVGVVESAKTDEKSKTQNIEIRLPAPDNLPKGMEFTESITLFIPISKLSQLPATGKDFAFRGSLKKGKEDDLFQPVWAIYGLGPNSGKVRIGVVLVDVEPLDKK